MRVRHCAGPEDFPAISDFLFRLYQPDNRDGDWLQPIFEYAYTHPWFDERDAARIGIWEDDAGIAGAAMHELFLGEAFFQVRPDCQDLKPEMLEYAEANLAATAEDGSRRLTAFINDFDPEFEAFARGRGYVLDPKSRRPMSRFVIPETFPAPRLPEGFRLQSLADDDDLRKTDRLLWRGFDHPGEPPDDGPEGRKKMESGPHFRKELNIVAVSPDGEFVAYAGLWFDAINRIGYVEPVCADPDYRRRGLGTAAVLEGIRRCGALGATVAYVGTDKPFYLAMGFQMLHAQNGWVWRAEG